jgi:hypothetical protein
MDKVLTVSAPPVQFVNRDEQAGTWNYTSIQRTRQPFDVELNLGSYVIVLKEFGSERWFGSPSSLNDLNVSGRDGRDVDLEIVTI